MAGIPAARLPLRHDRVAGKPRSAERNCQAAQLDDTSDTWIKFKCMIVKYWINFSLLLACLLVFWSTFSAKKFYSLKLYATAFSKTFKEVKWFYF